jgi:uncharacterized membrane protein
VLAAIIGVAVLHQFLPPALRLGALVGFPVFLVLAVLLSVLALLVGQTRFLTRERRISLRIIATLVISFITLANAYSVVGLVTGIIDDASFTQPDELLLSGAIVWITNVVTFALWFWHVDRRGPIARSLGTGGPPSLVFPEMTLPQYVSPDWLPRFGDYLAFSFATTTSFSPSDVSAIRMWAKALLAFESALSLALAALVIARAVNILT